MPKQKISIFWFRRDLRLEDNRGLFEALQSPYPVLLVFVFDSHILDDLERDDARLSFIHERLNNLATHLKSFSTGLHGYKGRPEQVFKKLLEEFDVAEVFANEDYEPYAIQRDLAIAKLLHNSGARLRLFKDQVIFAKNEVLKNDQKPYTVFTPYKNKWMSCFLNEELPQFPSETINNFLKTETILPSLAELGYVQSAIKVRDYLMDQLENYEHNRNFPALNQTSHLSPHLRFGTISVRKVIQKIKHNQSFLNELIWREFFMQILYHFPYVVHSNFNKKYDHIHWRNNPEEFEKWKSGQTGFPMVDAGMRELNTTGTMHNRVRMVVAGFLCKHLLIDWRWGEAYFAKKLLDYELSSNNGNWQWASGTGCDAAPYFRVFNPIEQIKKFDPELKYIKKWVPELDSLDYPLPLIDHKMARERAIETYKLGLR